MIVPQSEHQRFAAMFRRKADASRVKFALCHAGGMGRYLALPPGAGKSTFLQQDLVPMCKDSADIMVVPINLALKADAAHEVVLNALSEALQAELARPVHRMRKAGNTKIKAVSTPIFGIDFDGDDTPAPEARSAAPEILLHKLATALTEAAGAEKIVVMAIDDAGLLLSPKNRDFAAAIRAVIEANPRLKGFFLLDSDQAARSLFSYPGAPMRGLARAVAVKPAGDDFFLHLTDEYDRRVGGGIDRAEMREAWEKLGSSPKYYRCLLEDMFFDRAKDPAPYLDSIVADYYASDDWSEFHERQAPIRRATLAMIASGRNPKATEVIREIEGQLGSGRVSANKMDRTLLALVDDGVLQPTAKGHEFVAEEYRHWIIARIPAHETQCDCRAPQTHQLPVFGSLFEA